MGKMEKNAVIFPNSYITFWGKQIYKERPIFRIVEQDHAEFEFRHERMIATLQNLNEIAKRTQ